jgi:hypothetical protein
MIVTSQIDYKTFMIKIFLKGIDSLLFNGAIGKNRRESRDLRKVSLVGEGLDYKLIVQYTKNPNCEITKLCEKYGSDKGGIQLQKDGRPYPWPSHTYADFYSMLFSHCRSSIKKVFECGLGTGTPGSTDGLLTAGGSLRMWRDFFPNAMVYGADIEWSVLFHEERISTFYIDQLNPDVIAEFWDKVGVQDFDLIVDDGLHTFKAGATLFQHSIDKLAHHGIYIIEDVGPSDLLLYKDFFAKKDFQVEYVSLFRPSTPLGDNNLVVVRKIN